MHPAITVGTRDGFIPEEERATPKQPATRGKQISGLLDQKMSKLIDMVDKQRRDSPSGEKHRDPQGEAMKEAVDPHQAIATFDRLLDEDDKTDS